MDITFIVIVERKIGIIIDQDFFLLFLTVRHQLCKFNLVDGFNTLIGDTKASKPSMQANGYEN